MASLAQQFAELDLAAELRALKSWLVAHDMLPLKGRVGPRRRVRSWMVMGDRIAAKRRDNGSQVRPPELYAPGVQESLAVKQARQEFEAGKLGPENIAARLQVLKQQAQRKRQGMEGAP